MLDVVPPDESAGVRNSSVYTNAIGAATLRWCLEAAPLINATVPAGWRDIADNMYLPMNDTLYAGGVVHAEYDGYSGEMINQADVGLLQYPLGMAMDAAVARNDLDFYTTVTRQQGYFTGDSVYSIAYLVSGREGLGERCVSLCALV